MTDPISLSPEVRDALGAGRPVVALETSVVAQGLPSPDNLLAARRCAEAVRAGGAVPAAVAVLGGRLVVGATAAELERLAAPGARPAKAGVRDLAAFLRAGVDAGTTVSATMAVAARVGIRVFATGGIGGVHRALPGVASPPDVSSDLAELARSPVCVVAAGPKIILDVPATAEALETLGVPVIGFGTSELPGFYVAATGIGLEHRVEDARAVAALLSLHWAVLGRREGVLLCVPPPAPLDPATAGAALDRALRAAPPQAGKGLTPFLLRALDEATGGAARAANLALLERNAAVAALVAVEWASLDRGARPPPAV
jgi:pseudouridylate synthase